MIKTLKEMTLHRLKFSEKIIDMFKNFTSKERIRTIIVKDEQANFRYCVWDGVVLLTWDLIPKSHTEKNRG